MVPDNQGEMSKKRGFLLHQFDKMKELVCGIDTYCLAKLGYVWTEIWSSYTIDACSALLAHATANFVFDYSSEIKEAFTFWSVILSKAYCEGHYKLQITKLPLKVADLQTKCKQRLRKKNNNPKTEVKVVLILWPFVQR